MLVDIGDGLKISLLVFNLYFNRDKIEATLQSPFPMYAAFNMPWAIIGLVFDMIRARFCPHGLRASA